MADSEVFDVRVYDKTLSCTGFVGTPELLVATPRHNQQPTAALTVAADHDQVPDLVTPGARVVIHYRDEYLLGGPVRLLESEGAGDDRVFTFQVIDDWRVLTRILGWPKPTGTITQQGDDGTHDVRTGPAETVLKGFVQANYTRIGSGTHNLPLTVATSAGRGSTITVRSRMHPLADRLLPIVDQAGIGVTVRQTTTGLVLDCYEPTDWPLELSEDGGTLVANDWSLQGPEVTRVVVMASGEGQARVMRGPFINTTAENEYRDVIEEAIDARDLKADDPDFEDLVAERAAERLAEGATKAGLALSLAETEVFQYGGAGVHVGDRVTVELAPATDTAPALTQTEVLRSATLTWSDKDHVTVTPVVGDRTDDPDRQLSRRLAQLARRQRDQQAGV